MVKHGKALKMLIGDQLPLQNANHLLRLQLMHRVKHYRFWLHVLRWQHKFPAMKVTNEMFLNKVRNKSFSKRVGPVFETCTKYLDSSFLIPMEERMRNIGTRIMKPKRDTA